MKKHLIAAAVAAAVAVPAMAQVTFSGVLDVTAVQNLKTTTQASPTVAAITNPKTQATASNNGWATSQLLISGTEDLGGGLRASFAVATGLGNGTSTFADRDRFLQLEGGFGTLRVGRFAPAASTGFFAFTQAGTTSPAGQVYGMTTGASNLAVGDIAATRTAAAVPGLEGGSFERNNNNIQLTLPSFNGLTVSANYGTSKSDRSDRVGEVEATQHGLQLGYTAGPLSVGVATNNRKVDRESAPGVAAVAIVVAIPADLAAAGFGGTPAIAEQSIKADLDWFGASYNFGFATVGFTLISREASTTTAAGATTQNNDATVNVVGATVPFGALTFRASVYDGDNDRLIANTDDLKMSGYSASVTYSLSKRTMAYFVIGESKTERSGANVNAGAATISSSALGLTHSF